MTELFKPITPFVVIFLLIMSTVDGELVSSSDSLKPFCPDLGSSNEPCVCNHFDCTQEVISVNGGTKTVISCWDYERVNSNSCPKVISSVSGTTFYCNQGYIQQGNECIENKEIENINETTSLNETVKTEKIPETGNVTTALESAKDRTIAKSKNQSSKFNIKYLIVFSILFVGAIVVIILFRKKKAIARKMCTNCQVVLSVNDKYCISCGKKGTRLIEKISNEGECSKCGSELKDGDKFCQNCGEKVKK